MKRSGIDMGSHEEKKQPKWMAQIRCLFCAPQRTREQKDRSTGDHSASRYPGRGASWPPGDVGRFSATARVRRTKMPLVFENDAHFDPRTADATIWGDEGTKRFRMVIPRSVLVDKYGLKQYFDHAGAEVIIQKIERRSKR
jgi:hypothetical protein